MRIRFLIAPTSAQLPNPNEYGYNTHVRIEPLHSWNLGLDEARELQKRLTPLVSQENEVISPRYIAGVDVSAGRGAKQAVAAVVVLTYPEMEIAEVRTAQGILGFPYIPGFLSFREAPIVLEAFEKLEITPDLIMVDGQGLAHPRRLGIASHLGLILGIPAIGCAKSPLCGQYRVPDDEAGSYSEVTDKGEVIAAALRTKPQVKPVFVSVGHKVSLESAIKMTMVCLRGYRLPEPTRLAHLAAGGNLKVPQGVFA